MISAANDIPANPAFLELGPISENLAFREVGQRVWILGEGLLLPYCRQTGSFGLREARLSGLLHPGPTNSTSAGSFFAAVISARLATPLSTASALRRE
jgi:hypothetical protein